MKSYRVILIFLLAITLVPFIIYAVTVSELVFKPAPNDLIFCGFILLDNYFDVIKNFHDSIVCASSSANPPFLNGFKLAFDLQKSFVHGSQQNSKKTTNNVVSSYLFKNIIMLGNFLNTHECQPSGLFLYFKNYEEYCLLIPGRFNLDLVKSALKEKILPRQKGFSIAGPPALSIDGDSIFHISEEYAFICPANFEAIILEKLVDDRLPLKERWPTFVKMFSKETFLAVETSFMSISELFNQKDLALPFPWNEVHTYRLKVSPDEIRMQFYTENENARGVIRQICAKKVEDIKKALEKQISDKESEGLSQTFIESLSSFLKGSSIFVTAKKTNKDYLWLKSYIWGFITGILTFENALTEEKISSIPKSPATSKQN